MVTTSDRNYTQKKTTVEAQEILQAFLDAPEGQNAHNWEELSDLIANLVHRSVAKREVGDLEDFEEECILAIWSKINAMKYGTSGARIENFEAFVRQAVHNRYCDAIRRKRPKWYNLKLELLEIFSGKAKVNGFAIWQDPNSNARLCGYKHWEGKPKATSGKCREVIDRPEDFQRSFLKNQDAKELPSYQLAAMLLDYCGGPIDIDSLTATIVDLTQAYTPEPLSIDTPISEDSASGSPLDYLVAQGVDVEKQIVDYAWFTRVVEWFWVEYELLSVKQRKVLIFGMPSDQVRALCMSVGVAKVAEAVDMSVERLSSLVNSLPLSDGQTADELGIPAKAVPSVRFKAWGRIRRRSQKSVLASEDN